MGQILTFYSYKGGTGRSMAVANVAWILASNGQRVAVIDWDLEAPGLHRYFRPFLKDPELTSSRGIIDFVIDFAEQAMTPPLSGESLNERWYVPYANVLRYAVSLNWTFPEKGGIDFVPAGKQGPMYAQRVNSFSWDQFYEKLGGAAFLEAMRMKLRAEYDYVLIDSRTGVSDTSGICSIRMPDVLVICFALNNQGIAGAGSVARTVADQRARMGNASEFRIFPVPMRVDTSEKERLELRADFAREQFATFLPSKEEYWGDVEAPYVPYYTYEEILATFGDKPGKLTSVLASMERLCSYVTDGRVKKLSPPTDQERQRILDLFTNVPGRKAAPVVVEQLSPLRRVYPGVVALLVLAAFVVTLMRCWRMADELAQGIMVTTAVTAQSGPWADPKFAALALPNLPETPLSLQLATTVAKANLPRAVFPTMASKPGFGSGAISPDGKYCAGPFISSPIAIWNSATGVRVITLEANGFTAAVSLAFSGTGNSVVASDIDGDVAVWDRNGRLAWMIHAIDFPKLCNNTSLALPKLSVWQQSRAAGLQLYESRFSPDEKVVVSTFNDGTTVIFDARSGACFDLRIQTNSNGPPPCSQDGSYLLFSNKRGVLTRFRVQDWQTFRIPRTITQVPEAISNDGKLAFIGGDMWDLDTGERLESGVVPSNMKPVFGPNRKLLAIGDAASVRIDGKNIEGEWLPPRGPIVSRDGKFIITLGPDTLQVRSLDAQLPLPQDTTWPAVLNYLNRAIAGCLPVPQRVQMLGEDTPRPIRRRTHQCGADRSELAPHRQGGVACSERDLCQTHKH
jgi:cellulose biosynthesis protein BcsQ